MRLESALWRCGHRGACGHAPENTIASIRKAIELGVDALEFDIQLAKCGTPMVIHDDTLGRTTNGTGAVSDYTAAELKQFDAGAGERIPTLEDVLNEVAGKTRLFIELKAEGSEMPVTGQVMHAVMHKNWRYDQLFVISFDHTQIARAKEFCGDLLTSALLVGIPTSLAQIAQDAGAWSINPACHHMNQALVNDAHARGLRVLTWTVNDERTKHKVLSLGVDGIFSDFPDRL